VYGTVPGKYLGKGLAVSVLLHNVEDPVAEVVPVGRAEELPDETVLTGIPVEGVHRNARVQGGHLRNLDYPRHSGARLSSSGSIIEKFEKLTKRQMEAATLCAKKFFYKIHI
jgi:hypothetical protein